MGFTGFYWILLGFTGFSLVAMIVEIGLGEGGAGTARDGAIECNGPFVTGHRRKKSRARQLAAAFHSRHLHRQPTASTQKKTVKPRKTQ